MCVCVFTICCEWVCTVPPTHLLFVDTVGVWAGVNIQSTTPAYIHTYSYMYIQYMPKTILWPQHYIEHLFALSPLTLVYKIDIWETSTHTCTYVHVHACKDACIWNMLQCKVAWNALKVSFLHFSVKVLKGSIFTISPRFWGETIHGPVPAKTTCIVPT